MLPGKKIKIICFRPNVPTVNVRFKVRTTKIPDKNVPRTKCSSGESVTPS
jgi:hypothetical protein